MSTYVASAAMIPFGKYPNSSYAGLGLPVIHEAIRQSGLGKSEVQALYCGNSYGGVLTAQRIAKGIGLGDIPAVNVENGCSGGATAMHQAVTAIEAGAIEVALVVGVEKLTQFGRGTLPLPPEDVEVHRGIIMPAVYAMRARRYLHETEATIEDLAAVSVKARSHGARNPYAQLRKPTSVEEVLASRMIADPYTMFMCCPTGDGAAAVVVVSERIGRKLGARVRVAASVLHSGQVAEGFRDMTSPEITTKTATEAYEEAGYGADELDVIELHDAFACAELMYYECFGLAARGEGFRLIREGATTFGGRTVVNPSGGLMAKGHPVGATGVAQIAEVFDQLTGQAQSRQVDGARRALTHVTGGGVAGLDHGSCAVHIFEAVA